MYGMRAGAVKRVSAAATPARRLRYHAPVATILHFTMSEKIQLRFSGKNGRPQFEPVEVESLDGGAYLVLRTPGFVYGVAAGDEIEPQEPRGSFLTLARGGNIAVRVFSETALGEKFDELADDIRLQLDGRIDGRFERSAVFTIPAAGGFGGIEVLLDEFIEHNEGVVWDYGNVYDGEGEPLDWWL